MRKLLIPLLLLILCAPTQAAFTDFSDFTQNESFSLGDTFQSHGLSFEAVDLLPTLTEVRIFAGQDFAVLAVGPGVEFQLPAGIQEISFPYNDGAGIGIEVNGVQPAYPGQAGFSFLDGTTVAGVSISTNVVSQSIQPPFGIVSETGTIALSGPINSFAVAGLELTIDDVTVRVPEPSAAVLLVAPILLGMITRRRMREPEIPRP